MAKLIIEGDSWKVQRLLSNLRNWCYLGPELKVTFEGDEISTEDGYCICPPRKYYNPIARGNCVICGKPRK